MSPATTQTGRQVQPDEFPANETGGCLTEVLVFWGAGQRVGVRWLQQVKPRGHAGQLVVLGLAPRAPGQVSLDGGLVRGGQAAKHVSPQQELHMPGASWIRRHGPDHDRPARRRARPRNWVPSIVISHCLRALPLRDGRPGSYRARRMPGATDRCVPRNTYPPGSSLPLAIRACPAGRALTTAQVEPTTFVERSAKRRH
jgi:hypothetical protein